MVQMPSIFFSLRTYCALRARARGWVFFILCLVAKNEARKHPKGLCPLDYRGARRELSIFPPRGKNVDQHFSSVAKMTFANLIFASGNPKIPLLRGRIDTPFRLASRF